MEIEDQILRQQMSEHMSSMPKDPVTNTCMLSVHISFTFYGLCHFNNHYEWLNIDLLSIGFSSTDLCTTQISWIWHNKRIIWPRKEACTLPKSILCNAFDHILNYSHTIWFCRMTWVTLSNVWVNQALVLVRANQWLPSPYTDVCYIGNHLRQKKQVYLIASFKW